MDQPLFRANNRQLGAVSLKAVLVLFTGSLMLLAILATATVSFDRFRDYVSEQLRVHARDGATAVGLSLSHAIDGRDQVAAASLIDAVFDSGRYLSVHYRNPQGKTVAARETTLDELAVPAWFVSLVRLPLPQGEAEVVRGWSQLGTVSVVSHPGRAYQDLWGMALRMVAGALIIGGLGLAVLVWLAGRTLQPLRAVEEQARALSKRDFRQRVRTRSTRELNQVTLALNNMADELERQFEGQARLIEHLRRAHNEDALTGLASKAAFDQRLATEVESEERAAAGVLVIIQFAEFAEYNFRHGRDEADAVLARAAESLQVFVAAHVGSFAGRRDGAEFSLFMPASRADALVWVQELISDLDLLYSGDQQQESLAVHAGLADRMQGHSLRDLWAAADEALTQAQAVGLSGCHLADPDRPDHRNSSQWQSLIANSIATEQVSLWAQPMVDLGSGATVFHQLTSRLELDEGAVKAGIFVPMAERFGLVADIDRLVIASALALLRADPEKRLSVTLGEGSVASQAFRDDLVQQLREAGAERQRLILGVSEHALHHNRSHTAELVRALAALSVPVIVDRFGVGGVPFSYLRNLSFTAVRIDHSFTRNIDRHRENRFFVESVVAIAHSTGKQVFASGVETAAEYDTLIQAGADAVMGYHLGRPAALSDPRS